MHSSSLKFGNGKIFQYIWPGNLNSSILKNLFLYRAQPTTSDQEQSRRKKVALVYKLRWDIESFFDGGNGTLKYITFLQEVRMD
jgi:hypothetical protein